MQLHEAIKQKRFELDLTLIELGMLLGINSKWLGYVENGKQDLSYAGARYICNRLGIGFYLNVCARN